MKSKTDVAQLLKKQREISMRSLGVQYDNTLACQGFYNGDQMEYKDTIQFADTVGRRRRAMVQFNKVQSNVDAVVGFMAQNRRQAKYTANLETQGAQIIYSKYMNALYTFHRDNVNADQVETDQDADMMINGYGATETDLSYIVGNATTDPNGEILKVRIDPMRVGWDPNATQKNLMDARWAYYFEDFDLREALDLFQGSEEDDFERVGSAEGVDSGYVYNPWGGLYDKIKELNTVEWTSQDQDLVRVYNHQWMEYETFYRAMNPLYLTDDPTTALFIKARLDIIAAEIKNHGPEGLEVEDMFTFDPTAEELIFDSATKSRLMREFEDMIDPVGFKRKVFYTAVYSGQHIFTHFKSISQQGFSIKFKTGIYNSTRKFWMGMVNAMMEPAKYYNKALTELLFTIASNSKGGVMVEEDAVEDVTDFETKWAKTDAVISVRAGALSGNKIKEKAKPAMNTGLENIITLADASLAENGVDPAFMGDLDREDQSGILYKRRIRQIISKMARYFDSITLYQKEDARLYGDLIPVWVQNNNGKYVAITGEEGIEEFVQISEDALAPEYSVSIQEAPQTPEDRQETAMLIGGMADKYLTVGDANTAKALHTEALQFLPLDGDVKTRIREKLQPSQTVPIEQYQQLQAQLQQLQNEIMQVDVRKKLSEIAKNEADVVMRQAETASELENAANKGLENDIIRSQGYEKATVSI